MVGHLDAETAYEAFQEIKREQMEKCLEPKRTKEEGEALDPHHEA